MTWDNCPNIASFPLLNLRKMKQGYACFSHIPTVSYSNLLIDLVNNLNDGVLFMAGSSKYNPSADAAIASLVARGWTVEDAGSITTITANFTVSSSNGPIPLTVNFTDTSFAEPEYPIISWEWDFGDGSPHSFIQNPSHVYILDGSYTATLTVSNGIDTKSKTLVITASGWFITAYVNPNESSVLSLTSVHNEIYGGGNSGRLLKWDRISAWIEVAGAGRANRAICTFNNEIYCAGSDGVLRKWDGASAWIPMTGSSTGIYSLCVYNNKIYSAGDTGVLNEWDGVSSSWIQVAPSLSESIVYSLCVFNNKIYGGARSGRLLEWDGFSTWVAVAPANPPGNRIYTIIVSNNKLYGSGRSSALLEWDNISAWVIVAPSIGGGIQTLTDMGGNVYGSLGGTLVRWNGVNAWETIGFKSPRN